MWHSFTVYISLRLGLVWGSVLLAMSSFRLKMRPEISQFLKPMEVEPQIEPWDGGSEPTKLEPKIETELSNRGTE